MPASSADPDSQIQLLLSCLGYSVAAGWVPAADFGALTTHRFPMHQARQEMSVIGAFCLRRRAGLSDMIATPLVYVAQAADASAAQEIHRKVWSQGLAPFLLVATPSGVALCPGFSYSQQDWSRLVHWHTWSAIEDLLGDGAQPGALDDVVTELWDLRAIRLRTSLFWRDHVIDVDGRVDQRLLANLDALSGVLIRGAGVSRTLSPAAANGLIGRFLYVYFLADRGIIDQQWVVSRDHAAINLGDQNSDWSAAATWAFFDDLDSIFNGSIFPLGRKERAEIDKSHINLVRCVMKHGAQPDHSGAIQLSFLDFYFGALRTETLSSVYEQFLENIRTGERRRVGAFYTPPFLVDFMLDRIEEERPLQDGVTTLDPAAGSGVFLVGVYRRIVERERASHQTQNMDLDTLRGMLTRNIYGIERNQDACHVAAFSLYLTLLDYADPRDLTRVAAGMAPEKLFPELVGKNIYDADFFADRSEFKGLPAQVECVVGNPPWQTLDKLGSEDADAWRSNHHADAPIGKNQAAELFAWKALREHLVDGGVLGFLLPAKSFINPTSWTFRRELASEFTVIGAANFAHLRYRLFASARQAVVAAFVRKRAPAPSERLWTYSPLSVVQPMARKAWPWTILLDRAEVQKFHHDYVARDPRGWFEAFMLRPVDRQIHQFLDDSAATGRIARLETLCDAVGAAIRRGGNPSETGVDRAFLIDAPDDPVSATELLRDHSGDLFALDGNRHDLVLPATQLAKVTKSYQHRFGGNVLLVPRNFSNIRFVKHPIGYTSSTLGVFYDKPARRVTAREKQLQKALGIYLRSPAALYLVATIGRRWLMDRRNIEPSDLAAFPVPFTSLNDPRIDEILAKRESELDSYVLKSLRIDGDFEGAIHEFLQFRMGFQDGDVPEQALSKPLSRSIRKYESVLKRNLDGSIGRNGAFIVASHINLEAGVGAVAAHFRESSKRTSTTEMSADLCQAALARYLKSSSNSFSDSLAAEYDNQTSSVTFIKPLEFFRWTVDSAFADSRQMMAIFLAGRS
ncbi:HsdM family class I SAM-dependent methyltransferase [Nitrobacter sp. TKz-YC02]|uniref:HsdM family class I SAM-dependent methyltransferase n=1 Tax=Nitrobacter sp. TKz-YC02 TaxID=3398704 RepID=UPI003CEB3A67